MTAVVIALAAAVAVLAVLVVGLLRSHAEILKRLHDLGAGIEPDDSPARPTVSEAPRPGSPEHPVRPQIPSPPDRRQSGGAADVSGVGAGDLEPVSVRVTGVDHDTIVAFLSSGCLTCQQFWDAFRKPRKLDLPAGTRLVVVTKDPDDESVSAVASLASGAAPTVMSSEAWTDYDVPGSPYFVYVHGPTGLVRSEGTGPDWDQVTSLLSQTTRSPDTFRPSRLPTSPGGHQRR